ncbi:hypothetical protein [Cyclobacterium sp.]|nr:hypothetical protein [Cyclobacterium sp.]
MKIATRGFARYKLTFSIAYLTVTFQALHAARIKVVDTLKTE